MCFVVENMQLHFSTLLLHHTGVDNTNDILHGNTIAFQLADTLQVWVACYVHPCYFDTCPGVFMNNQEWNRCYGQVFQIFRKNGPGVVRVGDVIGLHYPRIPGTWFGCAGAECTRASCPGIPNNKYGFQNQNRWTQCWGEVFKIYGGGKPVGAPIHDQDPIFLYYVRGDNYIGMPYGVLNHRPCPGTWGKPNPGPPAYEHCVAELFQIVKKK